MGHPFFRNWPNPPEIQGPSFGMSVAKGEVRGRNGKQTFE